MQAKPPTPDDTHDATNVSQPTSDLGRPGHHHMTTVFRRPSTAASPSHAGGVMRHGFASFFRAPVVEDMETWRADIGFVGVPFDGGTNDRPGARFGPAAIRDASTRYEPGEEWSGWIDAESGARILAGVSMADVGDVDVRTVDLLENFEIITEAARLVRRNCRVPVFVGGDHAITFPIVRAFDDTPGLSLIQFDAHQDYTDEKHGVRYSHDNHMRRCSELPHVKQIVQIGLRGVLERFEPWEAARRDGVIIIPADRIVREGVTSALSVLPSATRAESPRHEDALPSVARLSARDRSFSRKPTSPSTSTCSTPRPRPAPATPSPAASPTTSSEKRCCSSPGSTTSSASTSPKSTPSTTPPASPPASPPSYC
jgi:arginase family enzyme